MATIGVGVIGKVPIDLSCQGNLIIVDDLVGMESPKLSPLEIEPLLVKETYMDFEFKRKKKPKNQEWQNRIKSLIKK